MATEESANPKPVVTEGAISIHNFSEKILEQVVHFHVMKMKDCFFLWVGATPNLSNLAVAMCSKFVSHIDCYYYYIIMTGIVFVKQYRSSLSKHCSLR